MSPWWADVLRPVVDALAPDDVGRAVGRIRNACIALVLIVLLMPRIADPSAPLTLLAPVIAGAFAAAAVVAHVVRRHASGPYVAVGVLFIAAGVTAWARAGAQWGFVFAGLAAASLGAVVLRQRGARLPAPPLEFDPQPAHVRGLPRVLHWLASLGVSVLLLRGFILESMHVPTGSMAPTLLGNMGAIPGDHVVVDRFLYDVREPRRWEIVVFQYPLHRSVNFVKRLVGLPGERVEIRGGDVWIGGRIARKPPLVQEGMWLEAFPRPGPLARPKNVATAWTADEDEGWRRDGDDGLRVAPRGGAETFATFTQRLAVADLRVAFTAAPAGEDATPARVLARVTSRGHEIVLSLPVGAAAGAGFLRVGTGAEVPIDASVAERTRIELAVADGLARALVDGALVAQAEVPLEGRGRNGVAVGASGAGARFRQVRVDRDVDYQPRGPGAWTVPQGCYFFLGDATDNSVDSRSWAVTEFHVRGRLDPIRAAASTLDDNGEFLANIRESAGVIRFEDIDGVPRELRRTDVERAVAGVPWPFARRDHLIGRATLIWWPWTRPDAGFRPRFLP